jgi:hypothetical protein
LSETIEWGSQDKEMLAKRNEDLLSYMAKQKLHRAKRGT